MAKFLIIRFSSLSEILLSTPVIRCLKKQLPETELHFLTKIDHASVLENNPFIDKVIALSFSWETMLHQLKRENYDFVIDLQHSRYTSGLKNELGVRSFSYNRLSIQKWIYTNLKWNLVPTDHLVDRFMNTVSSFGIINDQEGLDYYIPEKDKVKLKDIPTAHHAGFIGLAIAATYNTRKLPVEKLENLCAGINHPIILIGGEEDIAIGKRIAAIDPIKIYNSCGKFNLNESADLVYKSKFIVTHDSGYLHIAVAFKKPVISVWGNTVPEYGLVPYYGKSKVKNEIIEIRDLKCRPCNDRGYKKCPKGHFNCMNKISVNKITDTIKVFLQ